MPLHRDFVRSTSSAQPGSLHRLYMRTHIHAHCSGRRIWLTFHGRFSCALAAAGGTVSTPILIFCATGVVGHRCCRHQPMQNVGTASVNGRTSSMKPRPLSRGLLGWSKRRSISGAGKILKACGRWPAAAPGCSPAATRRRRLIWPAGQPWASGAMRGGGIRVLLKLRATARCA